MKLEVGMYVRTDKGRIGKVITEEYEYRDSYNQKIEFKDEIEDTFDMDWEDILKASHNIIDLIEVGDYVNGREVVEIFYNANDEVIGIDTRGSVDYVESQIKSILTKEQFEDMSYKVGEQ